MSQENQVPSLTATLASLGIARNWIEKALDLKPDEVTSLIAAGNLEQFTSRSPSEVFSRVLQYYAGLISDSRAHSRELSIREHLAEWLKMKNFERLLEVQNAIVEELTSPGSIRPEELPVRRILVDMFDLSTEMTYLDRWHGYLGEISRRSVEEVPVSHEALLKEFSFRYLTEYRPEFRPAWPEGTRKYLNNLMLTALSEEECKLVSIYYGLSEDPQQTRLELATKEGTTSVSISQRITAALNKLRKAGEFERLIEVLRVVLPDADPDKPLLDALVTLIDELELPQRLRNCMEQMRLLRIVDVVMRTEAELFKTKGIGRKHLKYLKDAIAMFAQRKQLQIAIGMNIEGDLQNKLDRRLGRR